MPAWAWASRLRPSKENGRVTMATVRAPSSRATAAITGAAPVPVPPPSPAVTNTMSAPRRACLIWSRETSIACAADLGLGAAAEAVRDLLADVDLDVGVAGLRAPASRC